MSAYLDLSEPKHIHFVGIGGISMSALATILLQRGWHVSGSDLKQSPLTERLRQEGATIHYDHSPSNVNGACAVVYTSAIKPDNAELVQAQESGIPIFTRAQLLGDLMAEAKCGIAVAGSHGKTTTTAMIGLILDSAQVEPTVLVGGDLEAIHGNVKVGNGNYLIAEACEYFDNFLALKPSLGVILNIDADHLDYFKDIQQIKHAFRHFAERIPSTGHLVAFYDDPNVRAILPGLSCRVLTYGLQEGADWQAVNIQLHAGRSSFDVAHQGQIVGRIHLQVPGLHNIANAMAAVVVSHLAGLDMQTIAHGFTRYQGTHRRFDLLGKYKGAAIYDDYAHHPSEIKATLSAARTFDPQRVIAVFQPHTYTRTKALMQEFANAFTEADMVLITDIYAAREKDTYGVSSAHLVAQMEKNHPHAYHIGSLQDAATFLGSALRPGDLLLTMGAGDVYRVADMLLGKESITSTEKAQTVI